MNQDWMNVETYY